jgi:predicted  nucleic acid-binding Zn-ribbon protein
MHPALDHLVQLQQIESTADSARKAIEAMPARRQALDARMAEAEARLTAARQRFADSQAARRLVEKDLTMQQGRLAKFKDQLAAVKTNKEYQAIQLEIATAQGEIGRLEDVLLAHMVEGDELNAGVKAAEASVADERASGEQAVRALDQELTTLHESIDGAARRRAAVAALLDPETLALFERVRAARGSAVVEARDGHCTVCHVRLRPQVYNQIRRNDSVVQCDSCGRILYFVPPAAPAAAPSPGAAV